jgi:branched-chain amino acid transport system permease protein
MARDRKSLAAWGGGAVAAVVLPLAVSGNRFAAFILGIVFLHVLWTAGMNLLYGYTGLVSMMTAGVAGIGAYATVNLMMSHGWSFWLAMPLSAVGAAAVGVILGLPALRLRGFYFVLSSLVIQSAVTLVFVYFPQFTNGDTGITQIPHPRLWLPGEGVVELKGAAFEILLGLLAFAGVAIVYWIVRSRMGAFIIAIREDDLLAEELGIDVTRHKVLVFFIGSLLMGVGGAFYASYVGFISPRSFDVLVSLNIWLMVAFGGRGTILGPVIGCAILVPIPFVLQDLYMLKDIFYGLLIIIVTVAMPAGVYGTYLDRRRLRGQVAAAAARDTERRAAERVAAQ